MFMFVICCLHYLTFKKLDISYVYSSSQQLTWFYQKQLKIECICSDSLVILGKLTIIEPRHEISNNVVYATSKGSDQPAHTGSLMRAFASLLNIL